VAPDLSGLLTQVAEIVWIDIVLSGDNAVVIGLACRNLPERQRRLGIALGTGAAVVLRLLLTVVIVEVLQLPFVRLVGGLLLIWIAVKLALEQRGEKDVSPAQSVFAVIRIIVIADAVMSLDNIIAIAAAAKGSILLVAFGLALSVPLIIFGATLLSGLFTRFSALIWAGVALLGYVGGELIGAERLIAAYPWTHATYWGAACGLAGLVIAVGLAWALRASATKRRTD
jgi:YjbE family integral membrane protein